MVGRAVGDAIMQAVRQLLSQHMNPTRSLAGFISRKAGMKCDEKRYSDDLQHSPDEAGQEVKK
jgi:hypothetical protein